MDTKRTKTPHHPHMKPASYAEEHDGEVFPDDEALPDLFKQEQSEDVEIDDEHKIGTGNEGSNKKAGKGGKLEGIKQAIVSSTMGLFR